MKQHWQLTTSGNQSGQLNLPRNFIPCHCNDNFPKAGSGLTHARPAWGELVAGRALAAVVPGDVDALGIALAQVLATVAFVNV